jgi:hypothetical protein
MPHTIVRLFIMHMYESCERHSFYVVAETDEGFTKEVDGHRTGSVYNDHAGLTKEEARDRALIDLATWSDFLGIDPDPFVMDGETHKPSMTFGTYAIRRELALRRLEEARRGIH